MATAQCTTSRLGHCYHRHRFVHVQFFPDVGGRETPQPDKARAFSNDHCFLVVLQQRRRQRSCRHRPIRGLSRRAVPLDRLDLQSQSRGKGQFHRRFYALRFSKKRFAGRIICRAVLRIRFSGLFQCPSGDRNGQTRAHRRRGGVKSPAFLLRRVYLEGSRPIHAREPRTRRWQCCRPLTRTPARLGVARAKMGWRFCGPPRRTLDWPVAEQNA